MSLYRVLFFIFLCSSSAFVWAVEPVTLRLKWKHQFQFAGYYAALEQGYYREKGFDVTVETVNFQESAFDAVKNGNATFAISDSSIVLHRLKGEPFVVLAPVFQQSPLVLMTLAKDNLSSPYDLIGKRVMYRKGDDGAPITAMLVKLGISLDKFQYQDHTFDDDLLANGGVDAYSVYSSNQPFLYQEKGLDISLIDPTNYGIDFYGDMLFAHEKYVQGNPERAKDFLEASLKGWEYALTHKEEIIRIIKDKYGNKKSVESLMFEAVETEHMIKPDLVPLGAVIPERFDRIASIYKEIGMASVDSDLDGLLWSDHYHEGRQKLNPSVVYIAVGLSIIVIVVFSAMYLFNRKLKQSVDDKTAALEELNSQLTDTLWDIEIKNKDLERAKNLAESANKEKSLFLANMSHEVRTPMNGIYGSLQLLRKQVKDEQSETLVANALSSAKLLLTILNDILDFSKIEAGKLDLDSFEFDIVELISSSILDFDVESKRKRIAFKLNIDKETHKFWKGDPVRIKQVVSNMVSNAIKFTSEGGVTVDLSTPGDFIQIVIADTGIGMNEEEVSRLFSRFEQADSSITRDFGGTGLGMAISKSLVDLMEGDIAVVSEKGKGTAFTVILPLCPLKVAELEEEQVQICNLMGKSILIAEDNDINQFIIESMFEDTGAEIIMSENGEECIAEFNRNKPDIILMDIQMPVMDGLTACQEIRKLDSDTPIIALTANVMKADVDNYLANGFNSCVGKPIDEKELFDTVAKSMTS